MLAEDRGLVSLVSWFLASEVVWRLKSRPRCLGHDVVAEMPVRGDVTTYAPVPATVCPGVAVTCNQWRFGGCRPRRCTGWARAVSNRLPAPQRASLAQACVIRSTGDAD